MPTPRAPSEGEARPELPDFVSYLPDRVYYLTTDGRDMWCRRPYGFFFTTAEAAERFAGEVGSGFTLAPIGVASKEIVSSEAIEAFRRMDVTRLFLDPRIDPTSGDVFGAILRIERPIS